VISVLIVEINPDTLVHLDETTLLKFEDVPGPHLGPVVTSDREDDG